MLNNAESVLINAPCRVNFAGLRGDTMTMQRDGWELNIETDMMVHTRGYQVRLAGRHKGLDLMMYSGIAQLDYREIFSSKDSLLNWWQNIEFPISAQSVSRDILMPKHQGSGVARFPVNFEEPFMAPVPRMDELISMEDIFFFQSSSVENKIYLPDKEILSVQDHLNQILSNQKIKQAEIREKKRKKKSKIGMMMQDSDFNTNPDKEKIKLQLLAI